MFIEDCLPPASMSRLAVNRKRQARRPVGPWRPACRTGAGLVGPPGIARSRRRGTVEKLMKAGFRLIPPLDWPRIAALLRRSCAGSLVEGPQCSLSGLKMALTSCKVASLRAVGLKGTWPSVVHCPQKPVPLAFNSPGRLPG